MNTASFRKRRKISKCQIGSAVPKKVDPDKFGADLGLCVTFREKNIKRKISACLFFKVVRRTVFQCNSSARQSSLMSGQTLERVRAFRPLEEFRRTFPLHARRTVVSQIERKKCQNSSIKMGQKFAWNGQNHIITEHHFRLKFFYEVSNFNKSGFYEENEISFPLWTRPFAAVRVLTTAYSCILATSLRWNKSGILKMNHFIFKCVQKW